MNIKQLEYFVQIASCNSMTIATEKLFITQPALSASMLSLEEEIGFKLFTRTPSGLILTPGGVEVLEYAKQLIQISDKILRIGKKVSSLKGTYSIASFTSFCNLFLSKIIISANESSPNFHLSTVLATDLPTVPPEKCPADIYILIFDEPSLKKIRMQSKNHGWNLEVIREMHTHLFINSRHPLASAPHITLKDLSQLSFIRMEVQVNDNKYTPPYSSLAKYFSESGYSFSTPEPIIELIARKRSMASLLTLLPALGNTFIKKRQVVYRKIQDYDMPVYLTMFYPAKNNYTPEEQNLQALVRNCVSFHEL